MPATLAQECFALTCLAEDSHHGRNQHCSGLGFSKLFTGSHRPRPAPTQPFPLGFPNPISHPNLPTPIHLTAIHTNTITTPRLLRQQSPQHTSQINRHRQPNQPTSQPNKQGETNKYIIKIKKNAPPHPPPLPRSNRRHPGRRRPALPARPLRPALRRRRRPRLCRRRRPQPGPVPRAPRRSESCR